MEIAAQHLAPQFPRMPAAEPSVGAQHELNHTDRRSGCVSKAPTAMFDSSSALTRCGFAAAYPAVETPALEVPTSTKRGTPSVAVSASMIRISRATP